MSGSASGKKANGISGSVKWKGTWAALNRQVAELEELLGAAASSGPLASPLLRVELPRWQVPHTA